MKIDDRVYVHGYVDEIRKDTVIIRNEGGYFGTVKSEIVEAQKVEDIVSVIRCKDCKHHHEAHYEEDGETPIIKHKCKLLKGYQFSENHYCGFAKRKEE